MCDVKREAVSKLTILVEKSEKPSTLLQKHKQHICCHTFNRSNYKNLFSVLQIGCNSVSWGPAVAAGALLDPSAPQRNTVKRFVSGGCDNLVKIWK